MSALRLLLLLMVFVVLPVSAQTHVTAPGGRAVSEWWYEPANPGWGLVLTHSGTQTVILYAGFTSAGSDLWQIGLSARSPQRLQAELLQSRWDPVNDRVDQQWVAGAIDFRYLDADHADVLLTQNGRTRTHRLERVVSTRQSSVDDYSGLWHNPNMPGFGMALLTQGPVLAVLATAYDVAGEPRWWLGYKLSKPNDPVPFIAKRFRMACSELTCQVQESQAGSISIQPRSEREISAKLSLTAGFAANPDTWLFSNHAVYANLAEPASGRADASDARPFHSEAALSDYLELATEANIELPFTCIDFSPLPAGAVTGPAGSVTNTQEVGIDEGDIIARSGDLVVHRRMVTLFSDPPQSATEFQLTRIRSDRAVRTHVQTLPLPEGHHAELVLALPAASGTHRFALVSSNRQYGAWFCGPAPAQESPESNLAVVRVNADDTVTVEWQYTVQALPRVLRRQGNALLLLTSSSLLTYDDETPGVLQALRPTWQLQGQPAAPLLRPDNTRLGSFQPGTLGTTVISVHRLPIEQPSQVQQFSLLTSLAYLYVGPESIFIASNRQDPVSFNEQNQITAYRSMTNLYQLNAETLAWRGSAGVRGMLYGDAQGSWGLQERNGQLRVLTALSDRRPEDPQSAALLTILDTAGSSARLPIRAQLPNARRPEPLGRVNEQIYGMRFTGDRLQVVSFRRIDPLYDVDLSNPDDPRIRAELDISGYSQYLHPLPDQKLLGFGVEVDPSGLNFFAPESLKLSLFNLGSDNGPIVNEQNFLFGGRFSDMPLHYEHHALAVFQPNAKDLWLTTPMRLWQDGPPGEYGPISVLRVRYDLTTGRVAEARQVATSQASSSPTSTYDARPVIYGNQLYLFVEGLVFGARLDDPLGILPELGLP